MSGLQALPPKALPVQCSEERVCKRVYIMWKSERLIEVLLSGQAFGSHDGNNPASEGARERERERHMASDMASAKDKSIIGLQKAASLYMDNQLPVKKRWGRERG